MGILSLPTKYENLLPGLHPLAAFYSLVSRVEEEVGWTWLGRRTRARMRKLGLVTYWVVPGRLMAGSFPGAPSLSDSEAMLSSLVKEGICVFVDLTEPREHTWLGPLRAYQGDLGPIHKYDACNMLN